MNKMNSSDLTARINRFMDRKVSKMIDMSDLADRKVRRAHRHAAEVSGMPYIALAVK